jgi:hypothetical protein
MPCSNRAAAESRRPPNRLKNALPSP